VNACSGFRGDGVNLDPTPEQRELVTAARRLLAAESPVTNLGDRVADGNPAGRSRPDSAGFAGASTTWQKMAQLGWFAIGVGVGDGGAGGSLADQSLLFRELGRSLAPGPLLGTALGAQVAVLTGRHDLATSLMAGEATAALAEPWRDAAAAVSSSAGVSGRFRVLDDNADHVVVLTPQAACLVKGGTVRSTARRLPAPDPSVPVSLAQLHEAPTEAMLDSPEPAAAIVARGQILTAALLVGILEAVRDLSVTYASTREQFGKPIGSFQAVKHRCADMALRAEAAGSLLWLAALSLERADGAVPTVAGGGASDPARALRLAAAVKALSSEYAVASAHDNVQNHGGVGFTADCSAHLYVKRALEWSVTLGSPEMLLAEVAR
jgi:alkylation response protein AidB-like acyl-CoA dehydrogenase